jgi:cell shape-determining protein MreC
VTDQAPPPAATIEAAGTKSERDIALEGELEKERQAHATTAAEKKAREQRINDLEDELRKLKEVPKPTPTPTPPKKPSRFRLTFFDPAD